MTVELKITGSVIKEVCFSSVCGVLVYSYLIKSVKVVFNWLEVHRLLSVKITFIIVFVLHKGFIFCRKCV